MIYVIIAFTIVIVLIIVFSRLFKRVSDARRQKVVVAIATIVLFTACLLLGMGSVASWTPLHDFTVLFSATQAWVTIFFILVLVMYAICGFSIGCGFLQVTQTASTSIKDSDMSMSQKHFVGGILRAIEFYFLVVIATLVARVLLDIFGTIYAEPGMHIVLDLMIVTPFLWLFLGITIATIKFWRDRRINIDFSLKHVQKFMAADKPYAHRMALVFWYLMGIWVFFLLEFFVPGFPGLTIFSIFMFIGFNAGKEPIGF
nr:hypothetical protein [Candidatus Sigynarchaeota archaeon]